MKNGIFVVVITALISDIWYIAKLRKNACAMLNRFTKSFYFVQISFQGFEKFQFLLQQNPFPPGNGFVHNFCSGNIGIG